MSLPPAARSARPSPFGPIGLLLALTLSLPAPVLAAEIEEIVVTAQKREEGVQEVPIAVTAISNQELERSGIQDVRDLQMLAPSFNMNSSQTESQGTTLRVRGVGTTGNNIGLESAVGVFLDGVYLSRPGIALTDLMDVERIEVLRGPQGTLFGRNTSAGAISVITKQPNLEEQEYWINASVGNFDFYNVQAGASIPVIEERLALRFAGAWREQDGFLDSVTGAESRNRDRWLLRGQALWVPNEDLSIRVIADYSDADEECCDAVVIRESPLRFAGLYSVAGLPANGGVAKFGGNAQRQRRSNAEQFENPFDQWGISVEVNYAIGDAMDLIYIGSYRDFEAESVQHSDFVSLDVFEVPGQTGFGTYDEIVSWTHELRLQGDYGDWLEWMVGFYYADEEIEELGSLELGADYARYINVSAWFGGIIPLVGSSLDPVPLPLGGTFGDVRTSPNPSVAFAAGVDPVDSFGANLFNQDGESWSIFTHNTIHMTDTWDFVFGLRWIDETKDGSYRQLAGNSPACLNTLINAGGLPPAAALVGAFAVGFMCFPFATQANISPVTPTTFSDEFNDEELTYTAKLVWAFNDTSNAYASFTHGFKAGGFNLDSTAAIGGGDPRFDSETIDAYELGIKSTLLDNTLRANLAIFYQEMEDFQVLEFTGVRFQTFNVPEARSTGAELEALWVPLDELTLSYGLTYVEAEYPSDCDDDKGPAQVASLCGALLTNSPKWTSVVGWTWEAPLPSTELLYFFTGIWRFESDRRTSTQPGLIQDFEEDNSKVNLRLGLTNPEGRWSVELWGNNVFDSQTKNVTFNVPLRGVGSLGTAARGIFLQAPRTFGATVRLWF